MSLIGHLASGATTVCRCWSVRRRDGMALGFTDHDRDIEFDGVLFRAESGMTARAFVQASGLAVDNSEAVGALSDDAITEEDIAAGRYDDAGVTMWLVNWSRPEDRMVRFSGRLGEITCAAGGFRAELRGLTEALNKPQGLVYQRACSAILGDARCGVDLSRPEHRAELPVDRVEGAKRFVFQSFPDFAPHWFARGRLSVLSGPAADLGAMIKGDRAAEGGGRIIELWESLRAPVAPGDGLRLEAGCDKRAETCRSKFGNFLNYRGFPHIPGEDWLIAYPSDRVPNDGGSLQ